MKIDILLNIPGLLVAIIIHECAHGFWHTYLEMILLKTLVD